MSDTSSFDDQQARSTSSSPDPSSTSGGSIEATPAWPGPRTRQDGDPSSIPAAEPSSGPGELATAGATGRPAPAVHHTEGAQIARGEASAPNPAVNLLGLLHQIQEQQVQTQLQQQQQQQQYQQQQQQYQQQQ